jgi:prepilin-type N-terminal cleavage/methylation domain-containing protein
MKSRTSTPSTVRAISSARAGFTLVEVLAALALMAIVVPVVILALHVASLAGEIAQRKVLAARIGERVLTENIIAKQWNQSSQSGNEAAGPYQFHWTVRNDTWKHDSTAVANPSGMDLSAIHELSVDVTFAAQSKNYSVHLSTLIDTSQQ